MNGRPMPWKLVVTGMGLAASLWLSVGIKQGWISSWLALPVAMMPALFSAIAIAFVLRILHGSPAWFAPGLIGYVGVWTTMSALHPKTGFWEAMFSSFGSAAFGIAGIVLSTAMFIPAAFFLMVSKEVAYDRRIALQNRIKAKLGFGGGSDTGYEVSARGYSDKPLSPEDFMRLFPDVEYVDVEEEAVSNDGKRGE